MTFALDPYFAHTQAYGSILEEVTVKLTVLRLSQEPFNKQKQNIHIHKHTVSQCHKDPHCAASLLFLNTKHIIEHSLSLDNRLQIHPGGTNRTCLALTSSGV